jgi:hypothetical protein
LYNWQNEFEIKMFNIVVGYCSSMSMEKVYARAKGVSVDLVERVTGGVPDECDCYECTSPEYLPDGSIKNNFKWHTLYQPCDYCDAFRTKTLDLGRKGYFVCPNGPHTGGKE